jgi:hypothetical protein
MSEPKVPDRETLVKWLEENPGLARKEIADRQFKEAGVRPSLPAISMAFQRYGIEPRRNRWDDLLPWRIRTEHGDLKEAKLLRFAGRRKAGLKNAAKDDRWLDSWLSELEGVGRPVVAYYPDDDIEPFQYHPRVPEDGDGEWDLIRRPEVQETLDRERTAEGVA